MIESQSSFIFCLSKRETSRNGDCECISVSVIFTLKCMATRNQGWSNRLLVPQTDSEIRRTSTQPHRQHAPQTDKITSSFCHSLLSILPYGQSEDSPMIPHTPAEEGKTGKENGVRKRQMEIKWSKEEKQVSFKGKRKHEKQRIGKCEKRGEESVRPIDELSVTACQHRPS